MHSAICTLTALKYSPRYERLFSLLVWDVKKNCKFAITKVKGIKASFTSSTDCNEVGLSILKLKKKFPPPYAKWDIFQYSISFKVIHCITLQLLLCPSSYTNMWISIRILDDVSTSDGHSYMVITDIQMHCTQRRISV